MQFTCFDEWHQLPENCTNLFSTKGNDSMFFTRQWFENLTNTALKDDETLLLCCVTNKDQSELYALLPLISQSNGEWSSLSHSYSSLYTILLVEYNREEILQCLSQGLKKLPFDYLTLDPVSDDDYAIKQLQQSMEASGFSSYQNFRFYNWFHQTRSESFADYLQSRSSRVKNTLKRKQRKLERDYGYEIKLYIDNDVEQALSEYHALYKVSWKANEQNQEIVEGLTSRFSKQGWPRLAILYVDKKPIAAHLWFVVGHKASIFRLVYDQNWKEYSPGTILMSYLLEYVIDTDTVDEIDFLTGNDKYKQDWMSERRERNRITFVKRPKIEEKVNLLTKVSRVVKKLRE